MQILFLRVGPESSWQPLTHLTKSVASRTPTAVGFVTESAAARVPVGSLVLPEPSLTGSCSDLLTTEQSLVAIDAQVAASDGEVIRAQIDLFKALGGGWDHTPGRPVADGNPQGHVNRHRRLTRFQPKSAPTHDQQIR